MEENNNKNRKITARELLFVIIMVAGLLIIVWQKANGKLWAVLIVALAPPLLLLFNKSSVPIEKRIEVESESNKTKFDIVWSFIRILSLLIIMFASLISLFLIGWWLYNY